jgi:hypothetical protein
MQRSTPVGPGDPTLLAREGARRPTPSIARADLLRCPALPSCWARHRAVARGRANRTVPRASAAGAVGRGAGCCPRSRRADSSGRAVARAELLGAARRLSDAEASGQQRSSCARRVGRRHLAGVGCCPRSSRSDTASSCSPTLAPPSCWARHRAVARGRPDRTLRRPLMREAACGVARAALLGATPAVVRGRGERTTAVEPCWPSPADGCCPGSSQSDGASNCSPRWRAAELLGAASGCCPRSTRSDSAELLGAGPAAGARGCVLGQAPSCWVRRRLLLLSDTEAIGQQVGRDVRLLPAVEPCWPASPWGSRLLPSGSCPRSARSDSAPVADARGCVLGRVRRAVGCGVGCCPMPRRSDSRSGATSGCCPRSSRVGRRHPGGVGCCPRSSRSDSAPATDARGRGEQTTVAPYWPASPADGCCLRRTVRRAGAPPSCWARHRAVARGRPDRTMRSCWARRRTLMRIELGHYLGRHAGRWVAGRRRARDRRKAAASAAATPAARIDFNTDDEPRMTARPAAPTNSSARRSPGSDSGAAAATTSNSAPANTRASAAPSCGADQRRGDDAQQRRASVNSSARRPTPPRLLGPIARGRSTSRRRRSTAPRDGQHPAPPRRRRTERTKGVAAANTPARRRAPAPTNSHR